MYMNERLPGAGGRRRSHAAVRSRRRADEGLTAMARTLRVLVCVKRVPAPGAQHHAHRRRAGHRRQEPRRSRPARTRSARSRRPSGSWRRTAATITVLTVGPPEAEEQLRYAVSVGADAGGARDDRRRRRSRPAGHGRAPSSTTVRRSKRAGGPFDLILFGNESADAGGFQVGIRVARALGRPVVNGIKGIEVDGDGAGDRPPRGRRRLRGLPARRCRRWSG